MKRQMRAMPRRRAPRSFTLDPALYARPKAQPLLQLYPVLRGATALTALLLIFTLALGAFRGQFSAGGSAPETATVFSEIALEEAAAPAAEDESFAVEESSTLREGSAESTEEAAAAPREEAESLPEADLAASATITDGVGIAAAPEPIGTTSPAEESLAQGAGPAGEEPAEAIVEEADEPDTGLVVANEADEAATESGNTAFLLPLQIGLGILFVLALIFWLIARRRARSL
jgi:hypothetical protein